MKRLLSMLLGSVFIFLIMSIMVACSEKSTIVGRWSSDDVEVTFFDDGTYSANSHPREGTYSVSNDQLKLTGDGDSITFDYKISGNTLSLTYQGQTVTLEKMK